ncbi:DNA-binding protein, partial [Mycolicibacterium fortuitum]
MTAAQTPGFPLGAWLSDLDDKALIRLLELRPDLSQPPPGTIAALAARATSRQSVKAATDALDFLRLAILDALLVLHADTHSVPVSQLSELLGDRVGAEELAGALEDLRERALVWGEAEVRVAPEAATGLPWYVGQATVEASSLSAEEITALLDGLDDAQNDLLARLLEGSPVGRTRDAAPDTPPDRPVPRLLAAGLLRRIDDETVILPRLVSQVMRGEAPGPVELTAPVLHTNSTTPADVDAVAAGAAIDLLREVDLIIETLGSTPVP